MAVYAAHEWATIYTISQTSRDCIVLVSGLLGIFSTLSGPDSSPYLET